MPRRQPAAAQPPQHDTRQPLPPLQGLQVRMLIPTPQGPVAHTFEPHCSARWGEHYATYRLWCGYCDDWHPRSDFSAQQCAAGRDVRYCLKYSQVSHAELPRHRAEPSDQACHRLFNSGALSLNGRRILALVNGDGRRVRDDRLSNTLASGAETPTLPLAGYPDPRNPYCPSANPNPYPYPYPNPGRGPVQVPVGRGRAEQGGVGSGHVRGRAKDAPALGGAAGAPYRREPAIQEHRVAAAIQQRVWGCNGRDRPGVCPTALTLASNPEPSREPNPTEPYPQPYPQPQPCPRHWPSPQPASLAPLLHGRFVRSLTRSGSCCRPSWFEQRGASRGWPRMRPTRRHGAWTWSPSSAIRLRGPPRCVRS